MRVHTLLLDRVPCICRAGIAKRFEFYMCINNNIMRLNLSVKKNKKKEATTDNKMTYLNCIYVICFSTGFPLVPFHGKTSFAFVVFHIYFNNIGISLLTEIMAAE